MRYILLLRGVNVGGKNKVSMSELKNMLLTSGFEDIDSYINSGNLFFTSYLNQESCALKVRQVLDNNYNFNIPFALITKEEYLEDRAGLPDWWHEELARKDVLFFSHDIDKSKIISFIDKAVFHSEAVHVGKHAIFWGKFDEAEYMKTTYHKRLIKQDFYKVITIRNGNTFEKIAEFINLVGAFQALFQFEDERIVRDINNSVNRMQNCDMANMNKTVNASAKQVEDINIIEERIGLDNIDEKLRVVAEARLKYPEYPLKEIAEMIEDGKLSKSGLNHRFRKIAKIAKELKEGTYQAK